MNIDNEPRKEFTEDGCKIFMKVVSSGEKITVIVRFTGLKCTYVATSIILLNSRSSLFCSVTIMKTAFDRAVATLLVQLLIYKGSKHILNSFAFMLWGASVHSTFKITLSHNLILNISADLEVTQLKLFFFSSSKKHLFKLTFSLVVVHIKEK